MGGGCLQELVFRLVFDSCSSFFALKLHGNINLLHRLLTELLMDSFQLQGVDLRSFFA